MPFISYAQNFEDVMLWRALRDVQEGCYIDIGAADPEVHSVTAAFYRRGWHGLNIEPNTEFCERLRERRPRDVNLPIALGDAAGEAIFYRIPGTGLSTCNRPVADRHREAGWNIVEQRVTVRTLAEVRREHMRGTVHFLKIDVEGAEHAVLSGADFTEFRPWIVVVEATEPLKTTVSDAEWTALLTGNAYKDVYFDGLNRFYVAEERLSALSGSFSTPPNVFDDFVRAADEPSRLMLEAQDRTAAATERAGKAEERAAAADRRAREEADRREAAETETRAASRDAALAEAARTAALESLEASRAEAKAQAERAAAAEAETRTQTGRAAAAEAEARALAERAAAAGAEARKQAERAAAAETDAACKAEALARLQAEHTAASASLTATRTSASWEITGPFRVVGLMVRRLGRSLREGRAASAPPAAAPPSGHAAPAAPVAEPVPRGSAPAPGRPEAPPGRAGPVRNRREQAILDRLRGAVSRR